MNAEHTGGRSTQDADPAYAAVPRALAERTGTAPGDWFLVFKARYGMEVVFRALADVRGPGDVVTQAFTCATAVDPVLVAGLRPVYAEVAPETMAIDSRSLPSLSETTRAVVVQHTFGIVSDDGSRALRTAAYAAGALLVEDSAHCVGRMARTEDGRPLADVSVHSFGVEKILPTRFGGAVWLDPHLDPALRQAIVERFAALPVPGRRLATAARSYRMQNRLLNRLPAAIARPLRTGLVRQGLFEPAIAPVESRGRLAHPPMRPSRWVAEQMARALTDLPSIEKRRAAAVDEYLRALAGLIRSGHVQVPECAGRGEPLVRFPCFVADQPTAQTVLAALAQAGIYAGSWYRPALFPGVDDPAVYRYEPARLPVTEDLIARVVNLPTAVDVQQARKAAAVVAGVLGVPGGA